MRKPDIEYLKKYLPKEKLEVGLKQLAQGIPPQYIIGNVDFYGNLIEVNKNVLIPRFETELLVEHTITHIKEIFQNENISNLKILDIGTGSGCIAITLKKELNSNITAIDISEKALDVAIKNAIKNQTNIQFIKSDIYSNIEDKFDIIISNPPYIREDEEIEEIVKQNEPHLALYAKEEGLYFYKNILKEAKKYLNDKFLIAFEIGHEQANHIKSLANQYLNDIKVEIKQDYSHKDRFIFIYKK